ncbi:MAG: universal stress protein [Herminiimonas sp.]|nr:universal stress protein [Herminiimonas sp.]
MFNTILVPTDGSALAMKAVDTAVEFCCLTKGTIIGLSVAEPYPFALLTEGAVAAGVAEYEEQSLAQSWRHVEVIAEAARAASVRCETVVTQGARPYEEIIHTAEKFKCDAIFIASHGRWGLSRLFVGGETQKVLAHTTLPVLVIR